MKPGTLFTNEGKLLFSLISVNGDSAYVWRWGYGSVEPDQWDEDEESNPTLVWVENYSSWTSAFPVRVLCKPSVHSQKR